MIRHKCCKIERKGPFHRTLLTLYPTESTSFNKSSRILARSNFVDFDSCAFHPISYRYPPIHNGFYFRFKLRFGRPRHRPVYTPIFPRLWERRAGSSAQAWIPRQQPAVRMANEFQTIASANLMHQTVRPTRKTLSRRLPALHPLALQNWRDENATSSVGRSGPMAMPSSSITSSKSARPTQQPPRPITFDRTGLVAGYSHRLHRSRRLSRSLHRQGAVHWHRVPPFRCHGSPQQTQPWLSMSVLLWPLS